MVQCFYMIHARVCVNCLHKSSAAMQLRASYWVFVQNNLGSKIDGKFVNQMESKGDIDCSCRVIG